MSIMKALNFLIRNIFFKERLLVLSSTVKPEMKVIFLLYNQHILPVTRDRFFITYRNKYYKSTYLRLLLAYKHI